MEVLDPESNEWDQWFTKPPMGTKRTMHGAAVAGGRLYVSGGFDGIRDLASAEMYDPRRIVVTFTGAWGLGITITRNNQ